MVHVIWREAGLVPHRWRLEFSNDPACAEKVENVVGLYVDPLRPAGMLHLAGLLAREVEHAAVLSIDEKWQIQALDRTQPGLPMKRGRLGTHVGCGVPTAPQGTHDCKRDGIDDALRRVECLGRQGDRPQHAAASPPGVHPFSQRYRARGAQRQGDRRDPRQIDGQKTIDSAL